MPETSSNHRLTAAIEEISDILKKPSEPFLHNGEATNATVTQLRNIFAPTTPQPS
jgi:hypothetical protein